MVQRDTEGYGGIPIADGAAEIQREIETAEKTDKCRQVLTERSRDKEREREREMGKEKYSERCRISPAARTEAGA